MHQQSRPVLEKTMFHTEPDEALVPSGEKLLVAVSGGADSMAMLCWLQSLGRELLVGHIHHDLHDLRGGDCDTDAHFLTQFCQERDLPLVIHQLNLPRRGGHVNEEVARDGRYEALGEIARTHELTRIVTAHTATDALETLLLNLMRGPTLRGLAAFSPSRTLPTGQTLVRPFWRVPRSYPRQLLTGAGWPWLEDASNLDHRFRRNHVRHQVLPLLAEVSGKREDDLAVNFCKGAALLRDELEWADSSARQALGELELRRGPNLLVLSAEKFNQLHIAQRRRILRLAAHDLIPGGGDPGSLAVEKVCQAVESGARREVWQWSGLLRVEWTGGMAGNRIRFVGVRKVEL